MRTIAAVMIASGLLFGCYEKPREARPKVSLETLKAKAAAEVAKGPNVTTHSTEHGQIIVVSIPRATPYTVQWFDCVIFRDAEFKTSSISCPPEINPSDYNYMDGITPAEAGGKPF